MWSDSPGHRSTRAAREAIAGLLPQAAGSPRPLRLALGLEPGSASPALVAATALPQAGVWLDGGDAGRHQIPLRVLAILSGDEGRSYLQVGADTRDLDVEPLVALDAMLHHLGTVGAGVGPRFFGFLGYDLGVQIEEMPKLPPSDLPLPDMWFAVSDVWLEGEPGVGGHSVDWSLRADAAWCGESELRALRQKREAAAAEGTLEVRRNAKFLPQRLRAGHRREDLPAQRLYLLETGNASAADDHSQRADP